jgi:monofunctional biosynthetic peptidoglycan transglycosylase
MRTEPTLDVPLHADRRPRAAPRRRLRPLRWLSWLLLLALLSPLIAIFALRWLPPPTTAYMLQSPTRPVQYEWVPAAQIADVARRAVIASEDQKFRFHNGFDVEAIEKAYEHNRRSRRQRGASTISQQTAKNLFLWPGGGYFRKAIEAGFTVLIEAWWGKDRILEVYLNIAEFGPGIYGVEAASREFFGKSAEHLSASEAAALAAVLPSPRRWNARSPGPYVQSRVAWILRQMGRRSDQGPIEEPEPLPSEDELPADDFEAGSRAGEVIAPQPSVIDEPAPVPIPIEPDAPPPSTQIEPAEPPPPQ